MQQGSVNREFCIFNQFSLLATLWIPGRQPRNHWLFIYVPTADCCVENCAKLVGTFSFLILQDSNKTLHRVQQADSKILQQSRAVAATQCESAAVNAQWRLRQHVLNNSPVIPHYVSGGAASTGWCERPADVYLRGQCCPSVHGKYKTGHKVASIQDV